MCGGLLGGFGGLCSTSAQLGDGGSGERDREGGQGLTRQCGNRRLFLQQTPDAMLAPRPKDARYVSQTILALNSPEGAQIA